MVMSLLEFAATVNTAADLIIVLTRIYKYVH